ncbi:hypothetical protein QAD02_014720 [Eretmocerus hayati]|uniref:Uncharacterized protein n=1 Tax=Eretmocerus hayati TaxID=131215 RepID=A0ACC2P775_9HYME|nr:hypothetical protein QAD02_014720 [Eretmocerus hayati]
MAFDPRDVKYALNLHHTPSTTGYLYPSNYSTHQSVHPRDENRNNNSCNDREICSTQAHATSETQVVQKVDAATMTDPLRIDFRFTPEYLAHCSSSYGLPYTCRFEDNSNNSSILSCQDPQSKSEYNLEPQRINGMLVYNCPECAYRFEDRETLQEHLEDHKQRPHVCDICGASLKRKEHLDRHKQAHTKERPYQCGTCCKSFKRNEHLARHMVIHSGSKNHICSECNKAFFRKDHLKKHLLSHVGVKNKSSNDMKNTHLANQNIEGENAHEEGLSTYTTIMRRAGPPFPPVLRT